MDIQGAQKKEVIPKVLPGSRIEDYIEVSTSDW